MAVIKEFWVVLYPFSEHTKIEDIVFNATPRTIGNYFWGDPRESLDPKQVFAFYRTKREAAEAAEAILKQRLFG